MATSAVKNPLYHRRRHHRRGSRRFEGTPDPRLRQIMLSLSISSDKRQEFILLSDTMGISMLVDLISNGKPPGATESTVFGPFYLEGGPEMPAGGNVGVEPPFSPRITILCWRAADQPPSRFQPPTKSTRPGGFRERKCGFQACSSASSESSASSSAIPAASAWAASSSSEISASRISRASASKAAGTSSLS